MQRHNIQSLTSFRFFAAIAVVMFHSDQDHKYFPIAITSYGSESVVFFFILSGFILTYVHLFFVNESTVRLNVSTKQFLVMRAARILPVYLLALFVIFPFFINKYFVSHTIDLGIFLPALILVPILLQAWYPPVAIAWNIPAWSLSVEAVFYLIFPYVARLLGRITNTKLFIMVSISTIFVQLILSMIVNNDPSRISSSNVVWRNFIYYSPIFHIHEFLFGVVLGIIFIRQKQISKTIREFMFMASIVLQIFAVALKPYCPWMGNSVFLCAIFGFLIFSAAGATGWLSRIFSIKPLVLLGESSYAMYIMHIPIAAWWAWFSKKQLSISISVGMELWVYILLVISLSTLTYLLIERPLKTWLLHRVKKTSREIKTAVV